MSGIAIVSPTANSGDASRATSAGTTTSCVIQHLLHKQLESQDACRCPFQPLAAHLIISANHSSCSNRFRGQSSPHLLVCTSLPHQSAMSELITCSLLSLSCLKSFHRTLDPLVSLSSSRSRSSCACTNLFQLPIIVSVRSTHIENTLLFLPDTAPSLSQESLPTNPA